MEFILGKPQSARSMLVQQEALQKAKENPFHSVWYIVPEQYTLQMQRELIHQNEQKGLLNLEVLSFNRLVYRLQNELQVAGKVLLRGSGKASLVYRLLEENPQKYPVLAKRRNRYRYIQKLVTMLGECYQYQISAEELSEVAEKISGESVRAKTKDLAQLLADYKEAINKEYFIVEAMLEEVGKVLRSDMDLSEVEVYVDGFYGFVPLQIEILSILSEKAKAVHITFPYPAQSEKELKLGDLKDPAELYYDVKNTISKIRDAVPHREPEIRVIKEGLSGVSPEICKVQEELFQGTSEWQGKTDKIVLLEAGTMEEEIRFAAEKIATKTAKEGYRFSEIAVLVGDIGAYSDKVKEIFDEYRITYFLDEKETIRNHPVMVFLQSALETVIRRFGYESLMQHLKSIYIYESKEQKEILEEEISRLDIYALEHGLRGIKSYQELQGISEELKAKIEDLSAFAKGIRQAKTFVEKLEQLEDYINKKKLIQTLIFQAQEWEEKEEWVKASQYRQVAEKLQDYFAEMKEFMGQSLKEEQTPDGEPEKISLEDFAALFMTGLQEMEYAAAPPVTDQVVVGSLEHTRLPKVKIIFALGLNESSVPSVQADSGFFSDWERQLLKKEAREKTKLADDRKTSIFKAQLTIYMSLMSATDTLYFSYARTDGAGKLERPSNLYYQIRRLFPDNEVKDLSRWWKEHESITYPAATVSSFLKQLQDGGTNPNFVSVYQSLLNSEETEHLGLLQMPVFVLQDNISEHLAKQIYHNQRKISISRLESFSACPFQHFVRYGLRARQIVPYEAERVDMGVFLHKTLEMVFVLAKQKGKQIFELTEEEYQEILQEAIARSLENDKRKVFEGTARSRFLASCLAEIADRVVRTSQMQMQRGKMSFYKEEIHFRKENMAGIYFHTEDGQEFYLEGVIDRMDICEEEKRIYFSILDYKTSRHDLDYTEIFYGLQLQLLIYLEAGENYLKKAGQVPMATPVSAVYFHMKNPMFHQSEFGEEVPLDTDFLKEMRLRGVFVAENLELLEEEVRAKGQSEVMNIRLKKDGTPYAGTMILPEEELKKMEEFAHRKAEQIATRIWRGDTQVKPYYYNKRTPCVYCPYSGICKVDLKENPYRYLLKKEKDDIIR